MHLCGGFGLSDQRVAVVVDYQNMHLTARGQFTPPGTPTHHSLLHPLHLANQILIARAAAQRSSVSARLEHVSVFRGLPSNIHDPANYARSQAQKAEWTRDPRVQVIYRPLRYQWENGVPVPREKGVDVLVALDIAQLAQSRSFDVVILAAHDTDLEPALEFALREAAGDGPTIETAGWKDCKRLRASGSKTWHTFLNQNHYQAARDRKQY
jgi:uncharacterized LabA/DUF88 family protein